ncbi:MAG: membrane protein insertase YidC, partial [Chitinophagaceae bacterium]|nr:membrane protein insertase YidC [Chitinophagaceae bacterium]
MKFDRNTVIGFGLLAILFFGFFYFNNKEKANYMREQARKDSIANASRPKPDTLAQKQQAAQADTADKQNRAGVYTPAISGEEKLVITENDLMRVAFSTKGGQPRWVELKHFKNMDSGHVKLANSTFDQLSYPVFT